jgi:hypothetical protein
LAKEFSGVSHYYTVTVQDNRFTLSPGEAARVIRIACDKKEEYAKGNKLTHPGVYSIKTNRVTMSAEEIWRAYIHLTKLESAFRGLKSELGLRPIQRQKKGRINSHLFVSTLAYQCIHKNRPLLQGKGINDSWKTIVDTLSDHMLLAIYLKKDGKPTLENSILSDPELWHLMHYKALNLDLNICSKTKKYI